MVEDEVRVTALSRLKGAWARKWETECPYKKGDMVVIDGMPVTSQSYGRIAVVTRLEITENSEGAYLGWINEKGRNVHKKYLFHRFRMFEPGEWGRWAEFNRHVLDLPKEI